MNRVRAGYPSQLDDLATVRREPADTVCFLDKRSNRSLHHSSNSEQCSLVAFLLLLAFLNLADGERFERPYPDSKSRVLPLDDPASWSQRDCFHAPYAQHRRLIDVMAKPPAIRTRTIHQLAVISATVAVQLRCELDFKTVEFNHLRTHNFGSSEENRPPISALKGRHPRRSPPPPPLCASMKCALKTKSPRFVSEAQKTTRYGSPPLHERTFARSLPRRRGRCREAIGMGLAHHC